MSLLDSVLISWTSHLGGTQAKSISVVKLGFLLKRKTQFVVLNIFL